MLFCRIVDETHNGLLNGLDVGSSAFAFLPRSLESFQARDESFTSERREFGLIYGPKTITEEQAGVILQLSNRTIDRMAKILLDAKEKSERGELKAVDAWRNDERSTDARLRAALEKRAEQYR